MLYIYLDSFFFFILVFFSPELDTSRLDLIDRVPDGLWTEVWDIVQETGIKTISVEKKCKKAKWLSKEALKEL